MKTILIYFVIITFISCTPSGTFTNVNNRNQSLILKSDKTFTLQEKESFSQGTFKIEGSKITLIRLDGEISRGIYKGINIYDPSGVIWSMNAN